MGRMGAGPAPATGLTVREALRLGAGSLSGSPTASLDAQLLLAHTLGISRSGAIASGDRSLSQREVDAFRRLIAKRAPGVPVAYLRGFVDWWDLRLRVTPAVMVPRPETELLAEAAIALAAEVGARRIADIGTGSGALAIALARAHPTATMVATDVSGEVLDVARLNVEDYGLLDRITLVRGDLLESLPEMPDLLVANLPYLSEEMLGCLGPDVRHEPASALRGGGDGLDIYRRMFDQIRGNGWTAPSLIEIDPGQKPALLAYLTAADAGITIDVLRDYSGRDRVVVVRP